ncbi:MAG: hypothetical protein F9K23_00725 [Bacteroidetes bacterium]|nr:MAG: hypothetical protein F9K23_00725 [Bacteroidota bacterium]
MIELVLCRKESNQHETVGDLYLNGKLLCHTLEDEKRAVKVWGETRIPAGKYEIKLRTFGAHHQRYKNRFAFHIGMLWLQDVPNFKDILIHIGNTDKDTAGCILVGNKINKQNGRYSLLNSTDAYTTHYPTVANAISRGEKVYITIKDE